MATKRPIGTIFVDFDANFIPVTKAQEKLRADAGTTGIFIEDSFRKVGIKSSAEMDLMRQKITNGFEQIRAHSQSTANDIMRAERAKNDQLARLNEQQFGKQISMVDSLKANWIAASAAIVGAWMLVNKAVAMMDQGAKALQVESSFKIMADAAGVSSERMIDAMKAATRETIDDSDMMQKAVKLMTLGFDPAQIERFSAVVITASQIAGTTAAQAFDELGDAIANRTPKALVRMGAVTREQMKIVTEAIEAGAESTALYELAMANLELKQKMLSGTQDAATISLQRFHAQVNETAETAGKLVIRLGQIWWGMAQVAGSAFLQLGGEDWGAELERRGEANILGIADAIEKATKAEIAGKKATVDAQMAKLKATADAKETATAAKKAQEDYIKGEVAAVEAQIALDDKLARYELENIAAVAKARADAVKQLQDVYTQATAAYKKHIDEIAKIDADARAAKEGTSDILGQIRREGMTPAEVFADREKTAQEKLTEALTLTGKEQADALKAVQREYGALAQEAAKAAKETAAATAESKKSADFTWDQYQSMAGQRSEAGKAFWGEPGPSDSRGTSAGAFMQSLAAIPFGQAGQSAKQIAQADAQKLAETVKQIGTQIAQSYSTARAEASGAAREAEKIVDASKLTLELLGKEAEAADNLAAAFQRAAEAAASLNAAKMAGAMAPVSGEESWTQTLGEEWQDVADSIVDAIRNPEDGGEGYARGGTIPGPIGAPVIIKAHAGETVLPVGTSGGNLLINVSLDGRAIAGAIRIPLQEAIARGKIQVG